MRCLVVYAHPVETSYCGALRDCAVETLAQAGHDVRLLDLYAERFDPVLSRDERIDYHATLARAAHLQPYIDQLRWAEALVFVYPTWWYGLPAILKGWLDRVWVPHVAFELPAAGEGRIRGLMDNIVSITGITTSGATWWWLALVGQPGRRTIARGIRALCNRRCTVRWLQHYAIDRSTQQSRAAFLARVRRELRGAHRSPT